MAVTSAAVHTWLEAFILLLGLTLVISRREIVVQTRKGVILSAGPFGSPHVVMLSGVEPASHLKEHNIDAVKDLPAHANFLEMNVYSNNITKRLLWYGNVLSCQLGRFSCSFRKVSLDVPD